MASIPNCKNYRPGATLVTSPTSSVHSNQPGAPIAGQAPLVSPSLSDVTNSNESDISVLTSEEIEALKMYSHSVQNFTYQLFENFRMEFEARDSAARTDDSRSSKPESSTDTTTSSNRPGQVPKSRKPSDYPRRKVRSAPFPDDTGL
ncbi:hypothetical protein PPACK8108_LOCUS7336 [Phakopsora pachyrhizi]|uniref:Uncharacterized protein n=1 Tax=Phakopsora pachyrhizi TaxID=170000 RepID=A0AAV0AX31_PHAPC|nr:hypothetical protein PPACK8108_LOCUS7336 [Phakopsora pachyrhizi]